MVQTLLLILIALVVPVIFITGLKMFGTNYNKGLKILAVIFVATEIFRVIYTASLFDGGAAPSGSLSFSVLTLLAVGAMLCAFGKGKLREYSGGITAALALVPIIFAAVNPDVHVLAQDTHAMLSGLYFFNAGLALTFTVIRLLAREKRCLYITLISGGVVGVIFGLTYFTNFMWSASYLFTDTLYKNILIWVLAPLSPGLVFLAQYLAGLIHSKKDGAAEATGECGCGCNDGGCDGGCETNEGGQK